MHDPSTVIFDIFYPWEYLRKFYYEKIKNTNKYVSYRHFITIWHIDPETDGTDDSCNFSLRLKKEDDSTVKKIVGDYSLRLLWNKIPRKYDIGPTEYEERCLKQEDKEYRPPECLKHNSLPYPLYLNGAYTYEFIYNIFLNFLYEDQKNFHYSNMRRTLNRKEHEEVLSLAFNNIDNLQLTICDREGSIEDVVRCCYRCWKRLHRPWYKHPRWHFKHWSIQIHPLCSLRRKLFTKCEICKKRFPLNYSPVSRCWDSPKVKWYESEIGLSCGASNEESCKVKEGNSAVCAKTNIVNNNVKQS
ncbi:hypothetical protein M0P65_05245 [Candidatus Gracilibacteria bacterium]|nr:hypothetical protein [Candidatus Gracilibacteria bacterium]